MDSDSASVELEKGFQSNIKAFNGSEAEGGRITLIDDSTLKEKKEMLENESNFISGCENGIDICSNIKEMQDLLESVTEDPRNHEQESFLTFKAENEVFFETQDSGTEFQVESVSVDDKKRLDSSSVVEEKQGTVENGIESISQSQNPLGMISSSRRFEDSINENPIEFGEGMQDSSEISEKMGIVEIEVQNADEKSINWDGYGSFTSEVQEIQEKVDGGKKMNSLKGSEIHEMPVIFPTSVSKTGNYSGRKERGSMAFGNKRLGSCSESIKPEMVEKKEKCSRRRLKAIKKISEMNWNQNVCQNKGNRSKRSYSRNEMEALRFVNAEQQLKLWNEIYLGLGPVVSRELDGMADSKTQKQVRKCADHRQPVRKKKENAPILSEVCSQNMEHIFKEHISGEACSQKMEDNFKEANLLSLASDDQANGEDNDDHTVVEEECDEDEGSDDEYESIQRPAFLVEGDPDFESGPPQDGLEYLKRVRWEAAKIPKVKVAKFDGSKLNNEQTVYMPKIPDIAKSPQHLLPSKQWEDAFIADFSELRLALSVFESSNIQNSDNLLLNLSIKDDDSSQCSGYPTVSEILGMDSVSRTQMLRSRIRSLEATSTPLSRNECAWVFALCAAVDTPLDADTGASIRCLLRKCSSLRAEKSESDDDNEDELVMLNILVTISGRYFGQLEN